MRWPSTRRFVPQRPFTGRPFALSRGTALDIGLAVGGTGLDVLVSAGSWSGGSGPAPAWVGMGFALLAGLPMGLVRRWPGPVAVYLSVLLVVCDQIGAFTVNTLQVLLPISVGVLARSRGWGWTAPAAVLASAATAVNLADPGIALTSNTWFYSVGLIAAPVLIGRYLRGQEGRRKEDPAPLLDLLLAGGGVALSVLTTWPYWHSGEPPVWAVALGVMLAGLALGVVRHLPGAVLLLESLVLVVADQYVPRTGNSLQLLALVALGVFATRAAWPWVAAAYALTCSVSAIVIVDDPADVTPFRVLALMMMVTAPVAIGRYVGVRQAQTRHAAELAAERDRAGRLAERERIAREVHDIVAHHVGAMVLRASAAQYAGADGPAAEALADIRDTGHRVLEDLRGLLAVLRDPDEALGSDLMLANMLADPGDVLRDAVSRMSAAGLRVDLRLAPEVERAPLVVRASAARIVQEGLTNVLKHAGPGARAEVHVAMRPDALTVEVRNGPGTSRPPDVLPSHGQGIAGMRERARAFGGHVTAGPAGNGGWRLTASLPVPGENRSECRRMAGRFA
ncbi:sensor histidine kinase [Microbispora sp. KK1-11]|uniref:sensor histidine kinase n=1 Tax=Microbispora sp. KK1-11 TaxID=2053005 RepID=UPI00115ADBA4|nr:histidine kinase [Microbispora sp. KK1-11]TQS28529.1 two-component sensor histidine kinase [Microbispora sp. KK1-11]